MSQHDAKDAPRRTAPAVKRVAKIKLAKPDGMGGESLTGWWKPGDELPEALWQPRTDDKGRALRPEADGWREGVHFTTVAA